MGGSVGGAVGRVVGRAVRGASVVCRCKESLFFVEFLFCFWRLLAYGSFFVVVVKIMCLFCLCMLFCEPNRGSLEEIMDEILLYPISVKSRVLGVKQLFKN